jgi:hypothetical protein
MSKANQKALRSAYARKPPAVTVTSLKKIKAELAARRESEQ